MEKYHEDDIIFLMNRRVFVAINLPDEVKDKLAEISEKWTELPVRWIKKQSLHVTLCFCGDADEEKVSQMKEALNTVVPLHPQLFIHLTSITLGPNEFKPRMIWVNGETTGDLEKFVKDLHEHLPGCECIPEKINNFRVHITLARITENKFGRLNKIPSIRENIDVVFKAETVELMESFLLKDGAEYEILHSVDLKK